MKRFLFILALIVGTGWAVADEYVKFRPTWSEVITTKTHSAGINVSSVPLSSTTFRLVCTTSCFVALTRSGQGDSESHPMFLPAGIPEYIHASPGEQIAAYAAALTGTIYINHMSR